MTVLLITLHRRYHELRLALECSRRHEKELGGALKRILVWAHPEITRLWFIRELQAEGLLDHVLSRPALEGPISYQEAHNIRLGLEYCQQNYPGQPVIVQAGDIQVQAGTYAQVREQLKDHQLVVYRWGSTGAEFYHTNFFAVQSPEWWPPLIEKDCLDVLEAAWAKQLWGRPGYFKWHNSREKRFVHRHLSENLPELAHHNERITGGITLTLRGRRTWAQFISACVFQLLRILWRKSRSILTPTKKP